jgi:hypothetical protein
MGDKVSCDACDVSLKTSLLLLREHKISGLLMKIDGALYRVEGGLNLLSCIIECKINRNRNINTAYNFEQLVFQILTQTERTILDLTCRQKTYGRIADPVACV